MTKNRLQAHSKKELVNIARKRGVAGWHAMCKDELVAALDRVTSESLKNRNQRKDKDNGKSTRPRPQLAAARNSNGSASGEEQVESSKYDIGVPTKDLSVKVPKDLPGGYGKDRIVCMVRDPYWLHTYWELTRQAIQRAEAALGKDWHGAKPILRLLDVSSHDTTCTTESVLRDIEIHGGVNNWYVDVQNPPRSYRIDIGYLSKNGQFYVLARSNVVSTPRAGVSDVIDDNWSDLDAAKADRIYAMSAGFDPTASSLELKQLFEERLRRPMGSPAVTSFGSGAFQYGKSRKFWFQLDAEMIVYGATEPNAKVTLAGRTGQAPPRRHLHHALQYARQPPNHSGRRRLCRWYRRTHHRACRRAQHQIPRTDDSRPQ